MQFKKYIILFLLSTLTYLGFAQQVQWAFKVLDHSSQQGSKDYAAVQALGMPNALPHQGESIRAWEPKTHEKESFIKVGYLKPIIPKQIIIGESFNAGHISAVYVYDASGKEFKLSTLSKGYLSPDGLLHISTQEITFNVLAVKVVLKSKGVTVGIDAIGITTYDKHFKMLQSENDLIKSNMVAKKMSDSVNSNYMEIGPLVSPDGQTLYFSRRGDPADVGGVKDIEDIWYSNWDPTTKTWGKAHNMGCPLNNDAPNFINSISPDGNTVLLGKTYNADGSSLSDGISLTHKVATGWSTPERLIIEDEDRNKSTMVSYFMSNSQKILMMSNNRRGDSYGENDIYVSFLKADNTWTKPLNLGNKINTDAIEDAPFLASDDKTLYFTSEGLGGYGGSDIYMSKRLDDTWQNWSTPENLGPVVNGAHDESFFSLSASGKQVFFTSQVAADSKDVDMYVLVLPTILSPDPVLFVHGQVYDSKTNELIKGVKISFENLTTATEIGIASSNYDSASYKIVLPAGAIYGYLAQKEGYVSIAENIDLSNMKTYTDYKKNLYLTPIEIGQVAVLNNVFFEFDKFELQKESYPELDRLAALLKNSATMKIELSGYTDSTGTNAYNDKLSNNRAQAVADYLLLKTGIDKKRIVVKHFGESKPVATNATVKGRELNRRVEFKILNK
jgi:OmpA-OmpF porin, OOP family